MRLGARAACRASDRGPRRCQEDEHDADVVPVRDSTGTGPCRCRSRPVLLPEQVVQEDADAVEAQPLGPAQLAVDRRQVEGVGLPHLELVDRRARDEIAADEPGLLGVPLVGLLRRPCGRVRGKHGRRDSNEYEK